MKSIKLKVVIIYLALVFIVMLVSGTFMLARIYLQESRDARGLLEQYAKIIYDHVIYNNNERFFQQAMDEHHVAKYSEMEGNVLNSKGITIASTENYRTYIDSSILMAMSGTAKFSSSSDIDPENMGSRRWFNYASPVLDPEGKLQYIIFTRANAQSMYESLLNQSITLVFTVMLALCLTGLLGVLFAGTLTGPIIILTKKSKELAKGNLTEELQVNSVDEIGQLTESFNYMTKELNKSMSIMNNEKNKMEIIQHNMTDGVLAYDSDGTLIHANASAQELLGLSGIENITFGEMMKVLATDIETVKQFSNAQKELITDSSFYIGDRFLSASFTPYFGKRGEVEGLVIVLQDITRHKKLDDMRKEFVANVSHEIRTPLTTIKSYTETLLDGEIEDRNVEVEFLNIINSETDRMALLVQDLLELSRFDSKQHKFQMKQSDLVQIIRQSITQNLVLAEQKSQQIIYSGQDSGMYILADPVRINQVISNIIGNAVKYGHENSDILISSEETEKYYRVYIQDSGIGIPKEDLNRVFERFYRVDKARSRAMGGTGLGLAIAKEIMDAHNAKIVAASEPGKGTTMILRFLKYADKCEETNSIL